MRYRDAVAYVEGLEILGIKLGLQRMRRLLAELGDPQRCAPAIHVVGSNGKSSTARLAAAALGSRGACVGTYLSPHVVDWRERIEVGGRAVTAARFAASVDAVRQVAERLDQGGDRATQFEVVTAAAFHTFARAGCDAVVLEAGLGGRYDATNVLPGDGVVALTNISLEHTDLLGDTERQIAGEKLAVLPDGADRLVVGRLSPAAHRAVSDVMAERGLSGWMLGSQFAVRRAHERLSVRTPRRTYSGLTLALNGRFQHDNLAVALAAAERLVGATFRVVELRRALAQVRLPGRLEVVARQPLVVLDGAHNPAGVDALVASLTGVVGQRRPVAVVSMLGDKDAAAMVGAIAGRCRAIVATRSRHRRAADPERIAALAREHGLPAEVVPSPVDAVEHARRLAGPRGAVLVVGSLYLLGDVRARLVPPAKAVVTPRSAGRLARASGPAVGR